ncbi:MAG: class I SAM-dependent methyltransferase [Lautropia sp.]
MGQASSAQFEPPATQFADARPSPWVERWLGHPTGHGRMLDFACGNGRHARLGLAHGFAVLAIDRDPQCLQLLQGTETETRLEDLESGRWSFAAERFAAIVVTRFLFRPRLDLLAGLLAPGGRLIYETFAHGQAAYGKPSRPAFLLAPDELFMTARRAGLAVVAFEQGFVRQPRPARIQRIAAVRPPFDPESLPLVGEPAGGLS